MEAVVLSIVLIRNSINSSRIGQFLEEKHGIKEVKKSFLGDDLNKER